MIKNFIAIFFHLPGIKIFYNIKVSNYPLTENILAIIGTIILCLISYFILESYNLSISTFIFCHLLWGVYFLKYLKNINVS